MLLAGLLSSEDLLERADGDVRPAEIQMPSIRRQARDRGDQNGREVQENELRILKLHELGAALLRDLFNPESGEHQRGICVGFQERQVLDTS